MGNLLSSLSKTIHVSLAIAVLLFLGLFYQNDGFSFDALFLELVCEICACGGWNNVDWLVMVF